MYDMFMGVELNPRYLQQPEVPPASDPQPPTPSLTCLQVSGLQQSAALAKAQVRRDLQPMPRSSHRLQAQGLLPPGFGRFFQVIV